MSTLNNWTTREPPDYFLEELEQEVMARVGKKEGNEIRFLCPEHDDHSPSAISHSSKKLSEKGIHISSKVLSNADEQSYLTNLYINSRLTIIVDLIYSK